MKFVIAMLLAVFVVGCVSQSPASSADSNVKEFNMVISHTGYDPSILEVSKGNIVKISAVSAKGTGTQSGNSHNHGLTIDAYNVDITAASEMSPTIVQFLANTTGTFEIYCKSCWDGPFGPDHPAIKATLVVK